MHRTRSKIASLLMSIIGVEFAKTDTSFLRYPSSFEIWNNSSQNALSCYIYNKLPRLYLFDLHRYMTARSISCIDIGSRGARVSPSLCLAIVPLFLPSSPF